MIKRNVKMIEEKKKDEHQKKMSGFAVAVMNEP